MKVLLSLDLGTTTTRAFIIDLQGNLIAKATKENPFSFPHSGWVEQSPLHLWQNVNSVIREALGQAKVSYHQIHAIGIANQRETTILWDKKTGKPVANAIVWQDRRTADYCAYLKKQGTDKFITSKTGLTLDPYFAATKIRFILEHFSGAQKLASEDQLAFGTVDSWLIFQMTKGKVHATDASNAARTLLFNIHTLEWDKDLLQLFDIPFSILPKVCNSSGFIGEADLNGAPVPIPITAVIGDQSGALFGQHCLKKGMAKITYGTGCFAMVQTEKKIFSSKQNLLSTIAWQINNKVSYALEGSIFIGGAAFQWLRDNLKLINSYEEIEKLALSVADNNGVYFVPALTGLGAPHWDPKAQGTIFGLTRSTEVGHLARAAVEGIAFQVSDLMDTLNEDLDSPIKELRVDGGASQNNFLMQFQADLLNIPLIRPKKIETTGFGAAYLAALGAGLWKNLDDIEKFREVDRIFEPNPSANLKDSKERWKKAIECVKLWNNG